MQTFKDATAKAAKSFEEMTTRISDKRGKKRPMTGPEHRQARRASERGHAKKMRRFNLARSKAGQLRTAAENLSESQARVLAGEVGTPEMRRNVYTAVRDQVRREAAKELHRSDFPDRGEFLLALEAETDRRMAEAGIA